MGITRKYLQLKTVIAAKRRANAHAVPCMSVNDSPVFYGGERVRGHHGRPEEQHALLPQPAHPRRCPYSDSWDDRQRQIIPSEIRTSSAASEANGIATTGLVSTGGDRVDASPLPNPCFRVNTLNTVSLEARLKRNELFRVTSPDCNIVMFAENDARVGHKQSAAFRRTASSQNLIYP
jgi:hypothetical protein